MRSSTKINGYYIGAAFCLLGVLVNIGKTGNKWALLTWGPLSVALTILAYRHNVKKKKKKEDYQNAVSRLKEIYKAALVENDAAKTEQIVVETGLSSKDIAGAAVKSMMQDVFHEETASGALSPDGYERILSVANSLHVNFSSDKQTELLLSKYLQYWSIENEQLPAISVTISLKKGEICHYHFLCRWMEHRTVTKSVAYSGVTGSFKIAKGVRYRIGQFKPMRITSDALAEIDRGEVWLTNQRLIFMGAHKNTTIKYASVLSIVPYSDGIGVQKDSGKSPILLCEDADIVARVFTRLNAI